MPGVRPGDWPELPAIAPPTATPIKQGGGYRRLTPSGDPSDVVFRSECRYYGMVGWRVSTPTSSWDLWRGRVSRHPVSAETEDLHPIPTPLLGERLAHRRAAERLTPAQHPHGTLGVDEQPRRPVIPRLGPLHGMLAHFTPSQVIVSRLSAGLDVHQFAALVDHTDLQCSKPPPGCQRPTGPHGIFGGLLLEPRAHGRC